jgi:tetratricopeptide (TPR) repeat protein
MVSLKKLRPVQGATLVLLLASGAAAQTATAVERLAEGEQLRAQGRYAEAHKVFAALLHEAGASQLCSSLMIQVLDNQGRTEHGLGNYVEAESLLKRALSACRKDASPDDREVNQVKIHLAEVYVEERRPDDADPLLRQAAASLRNGPVPDPVSLGITYNDLAVACAMRRNWTEAEALLRQALALLEGALGVNDPVLASTLNPLAALMLAQHRYAEAVAPAERAWKILQADAPHIADKDLAGSLDALGVVYWRNGRMREAEACAGQAAAMAEAIYGPDHPYVGYYLANYAAILKQLNRKTEAAKAAKRANAILAQSARDNPTQHTVSVNALR